VIPIFPKKFFEDFVREHPVQAIIFLAFGFTMLVFAITFVVMK
jgi:hypothetical protein